MNKRPFLTARWERLAIVTYAVDPALLASHTPPDCELDAHPRWPGKAFVSLVGFDFLDTRVKGVRWAIPWTRMVDFPEVNLRFYVRGAAGRGVCFVREFVPSRIVCAVARLVYNEPYRAVALRSTHERTGGELRVRYECPSQSRSAGAHSITILADGTPSRPPTDSVEHFFKEHDVGFGTSRRGSLVTYRVEHPVWDVHQVRSCAVGWDFAATYGRTWSGLNGAEPIHTMLAAGSAVVVDPH